MSDKDFEAVSEVAGNIEVVLNKKNPEFDPYEPILDQIQFSIGKTGRSNKINFDRVTSENIQDLIDTLELVKDSLKQVEPGEREGDFDVDIIEPGISESNLSHSKKKIIRHMVEQEAFIEPISQNELLDEENFDKEEINELMNDGRIYYPTKGMVKLMPEPNSSFIVGHLINELESESDEIEIKSLVKKAVGSGLEKEEAKNQIEKLKRNGELYEPKQGFIQKI